MVESKDNLILDSLSSAVTKKQAAGFTMNQPRPEYVKPPTAFAAVVKHCEKDASQAVLSTGS